MTLHKYTTDENIPIEKTQKRHIRVSSTGKPFGAGKGYEKPSWMPKPSFELKTKGNISAQKLVDIEQLRYAKKMALLEGDKDDIQSIISDIRDLTSIRNDIANGKFQSAVNKIYELDTVIRDELPPMVYNMFYNYEDIPYEKITPKAQRMVQLMNEVIEKIKNREIRYYKGVVKEGEEYRKEYPHGYRGQ